jgi:hypothetical protein
MVDGNHDPREPRPAPHHGTIGRSLFQLGQIVATPGALRMMEDHGINAGELLRRHASGDWGDLCEEDRAENGRALRMGSRLLSAYGDTERGTRLWVITEAGDRSVTTILRPEDY